VRRSIGFIVRSCKLVCVVLGCFILLFTKLLHLLRHTFAAYTSLVVHRAHQTGDLFSLLCWCDLTNGEGCGSKKMLLPPGRGAFQLLSTFVLQYEEFGPGEKISMTKEGLQRPPLRLYNQSS
jgi:hypothetical protein